MEEQEYKAYLVMKIPIQDRNDRVRYACISSSWIRATEDSIVVFGYPLEDRMTTELRLLEYESLDVTWPLFHGEVVFETDSLQSANEFLKRELNMNQLESNCDQLENTNKKMEDITTKTIRINIIKLPAEKLDHSTQQNKIVQEKMSANPTVCNQLGKEVDLEISEAYEIIRTYEGTLDCEGSLPNSFNNTEISGTNITFPNEIDIEALEETPVNTENATNKMGQIRRQAIRKTRNLSQSYSEISDEEFEKSGGSASSTISIYSENYVENDNYPRPNTSKQSIPSGLNNNALDNEDIVMNLLDDQIHSNLYNFYVNVNESYQNNMSNFDNITDYLLKVICTRKHNTEVANQSQSSYTEHTEAMNQNIYSNPQPLLQERVSHEDTKCTLRYPEPGQGVIELLPNTGVYVSVEGLQKCQSRSFTTSQLARGLLEELFTDKALKTCSFTGRGQRNHKPGLDSKARESLIDYVSLYSTKKGWEKADRETIKICITNRLAKLNRLGLDEEIPPWYLI